MQISKESFADALADLGHNPADYDGKRLSLASFCDLYEMDQNSVLEAINTQAMSAHYDYSNDTIWIDALDAAHFYYCVKSKSDLLKHL